MALHGDIDMESRDLLVFTVVTEGIVLESSSAADYYALIAALL